MRGGVVFGLLLVGTFATIVSAYLLTEYLLTRFDVRRRVLVGDGSPLMAILAANGLSFLLVTLSSLVMLFAAGIGLYAGAVLVCLCAQGVWLTQHLWFYYRDHLRLRYE
ncbi:MAG: hypothetical protein IT536_12505 [Hyphomicrobiales bacterium]|nr:hypothetical protein [Hyphomicrobiales bacterium]